MDRHSISRGSVTLWRRSLALATLLLGCHQATLPELVDAAKARWKRATCIRETPSVVVTMGPRKLVCGQREDAWGCHWPGRIVLSRSTPRHYWLQVLTHEFGHEVDLAPTNDLMYPDHVPAGHGLMSTSIAGAHPYITMEDIELACRKRVCPCRNPEE